MNDRRGRGVVLPYILQNLGVYSSLFAQVLEKIKTISDFNDFRFFNTLKNNKCTRGSK